MEIMRANVDELTGNFETVKKAHYSHVDKAFISYLREDEENNAEPTLVSRQNDNGTKALSLIRQLKRAFRNDEIYDKIVVLEGYVISGIFNRLTKGMNQLNLQVNKMTKNGSRITDHVSEILPIIENFYDKYYVSTERKVKEDAVEDIIIVTSETFE